MKKEAAGPLQRGLVKTDETQSNPIKANQTEQIKSNLLAGLSSASLRRRLRLKVLWLCDFCVVLSRSIPLALLESGRIKPNLTKSNQIKPVSGKYLWHMELHWSGMGFNGVLGL